MGEPTVLDLWVCPDCGAGRTVHEVDGPILGPGSESEIRCWHGGYPVAMVRRRALVLDDAAVEAAAFVICPECLSADGEPCDGCVETARATLGMEAVKDA